jgi:hypothetical protein
MQTIAPDMAQHKNGQKDLQIRLSMSLLAGDWTSLKMGLSHAYHWSIRLGLTGEAN